MKKKTKCVIINNFINYFKHWYIGIIYKLWYNWINKFKFIK